MPLVTRPMPVTPDERLARGDWPRTTFSRLLAMRAATTPDKTALVDAHRRVTYREWDERASSIACDLAARGVQPGDVVSTILPNRIDAAEILVATHRLGAIANPILPIFRGREVRFILRQCASVAVVAVDRWAGCDFREILERARPELPSLRSVIPVDSIAGDERGPSISNTEGPVADARFVDQDPTRVSFILYTSGTTAEPKGVLHCDGTLLAECRSIERYHGLGSDEVFVMASPVAHISGLLYGFLLPLSLGATGVLMERWEPKEFLELVRRERGTYSAGATPFLQGVVDALEGAPGATSSLRIFPCGGADVPPELIRRAIRRLGVRTGRGYGSTEHPTITSSAGPAMPEKRRAETDGRPLPGNEIELRDEHGQLVSPGIEGEVWASGPELCLGYRDPALNRDAFDERGFFATGDLGVLDGDGYLTITGRRKDVIVRSGEKISAKEVEDLLHEHPKVRRVAVVAMPDARTGERACAFIVAETTLPAPSLDELVAFLEERELSRRKFPERLEIVDELPVTASGKVRKDLLREQLARRGPEETASP